MKDIYNPSGYGYNQMATSEDFIEAIEEHKRIIAYLQEKISRRNMQIKDRDKKIGLLEEKLHQEKISWRTISLSKDDLEKMLTGEFSGLTLGGVNVVINVDLNR